MFRKRFLHVSQLPTKTRTGRRRSNIERVSELLGDGEWHYTRDLARRAGHRFGSSIAVLRSRGVEIASEPVKGGKRRQWRYRLAA